MERLRELNVTPHVARNTTNRSSAIDGRTTRHGGYEVSQRKRKRVEEVFGWLKTVAAIRKTRLRGSDLIGWMFTLAAAAYNLVRMRNLAAAPPESAVVPPNSSNRPTPQNPPLSSDKLL